MKTPQIGHKRVLPYLVKCMIMTFMVSVENRPAIDYGRPLYAGKASARRDSTHEDKYTSMLPNPIVTGPKG